MAAQIRATTDEAPEDTPSLVERTTGVRAREPLGEEPSCEADGFQIPGVSGDDCVRGLLASGCMLEGLVGRAWLLTRHGRCIMVPRHALLDAEVLIEILGRAEIPLERFRRTLSALDLLRGHAAPQPRPAAPMVSDLPPQEPAIPPISGDELAEMLRALGWVVWEKGPLVLRLGRNGQTLVIPREHALPIHLVRFLVARAR